VSPVTLPEVATSFAVIFLVYSFVFGIGVHYLLAMMRKPPEAGEAPPQSDAPLRSYGKAVLTPGPAVGD